jgi:hypothetical protein
MDDGGEGEGDDDDLFGEGDYAPHRPAMAGFGRRGVRFAEFVALA